MDFSQFDLQQDVVEGIESMGFTTATPIQEAAIPAITSGKDLIACAQTGTGKTGAFLIPVLDGILKQKQDEKIKALVIVPTRELAIQIDQQVQGLSYFLNISSLAIYGGNDSKGWDKQKSAIKQGVDVLIATPGRILAHIALGYVDFSALSFFILDEADRMLDMGFHADIMKIHEGVAKDAQKLMFSATMPSNIRGLIQKILTDPTEINIAVSKPNENILQAAYSLHDRQKIPLVLHLLKDKEEDLKSVIIFISSKKKAAELEDGLRRINLNARAIHSDLDQKNRETVMLDFRNKKIQILVATDIVARGIDIDEVGLVMNFDVPKDPEDYIHRIGRTARAEATGVALTLINQQEQYLFDRIERFIGSTIHKTPAPPELGETPAYDPKSNPKSNPKSSRGYGGGSNSKSGGSKKWPRKGKSNNSNGKATRPPRT